MPVWKRSLSRLLAALALLAPAAHAEFRVEELQARVLDGALVLNGHMQLELSRKVEEAVSKGIELPVIVEARLYRKRALLWDQHLESWLVRRGLRYHALSGQYIVGLGASHESFRNAADALKQLGTLSELHLPLGGAAVAETDTLLVKLRVSIDIELLPAPLRPVAYTTLSWHLNSGWSAWNVTP